MVVEKTTTTRDITVKIERLKKLDKNGNRRVKLTFFRMEDGVLVKYKSCTTNEAIDHLSAEDLIAVWGKVKKRREV